MENKVYCVSQDYGSWDNYANNLVGIFSTNEEAEDVAKLLTAGLEKFRSDYPKPIRPGYDPEGEDVSPSASEEYHKNEIEWHHAVFRDERHEMMSVNYYLVVEKPLNQLFTECRYFL